MPVVDLVAVGGAGEDRGGEPVAADRAVALEFGGDGHDGLVGAEAGGVGEAQIGVGIGQGELVFSFCIRHEAESREDRAGRVRQRQAGLAGEGARRLGADREGGEGVEIPGGQVGGLGRCVVGGAKRRAPVENPGQGVALDPQDEGLLSVSNVMNAICHCVPFPAPAPGRVI